MVIQIILVIFDLLKNDNHTMWAIFLNPPSLVISRNLSWTSTLPHRRSFHTFYETSITCSIDICMAKGELEY